MESRQKFHLLTACPRPSRLDGNTTLSNDSGTVGWDVISEVWSDHRDAADSVDRWTGSFGKWARRSTTETFEILGPARIPSPRS